jgi:hypothetical protein
MPKETNVSVMMISDIAGQTAEGYAGMLATVKVALRRAPGFVMHSSHPTEGGWRVIEIWASREDSARFYAAHVAPNLPKGLRPKLEFVDLHDVLPG